MHQLIRGILTNPSDKTKITLLFGINTDDDALFRTEFTQYQKQFPDRFKAVYTVTNPSPNSEFRRGRVTKELIREVVGEEEIRSAKGKVFLCGPPAMETAMVGKGRGGGGILGELGVGKELVFKF
ncbi:hypothetical protein G7Y89_g15212 [Cudoniella acicularis]|uniref:Oxidoreductase FAD/NAD(P)-binding domain-containing protein n=1 Tax=Cudoniella acicularis TaxID=354080 RepID=A0A8H4QTQ3_9HELO|nr:hypothetical protein G7Y89_g15212 [Cudoniella acicularis]